MPEQGRRTWRATDFITAIAVVVLIAGIAQLVAGALEAGITVDEPTQVDRTAAWIESGWYVPDGYLKEGRPDPENDLATPYVYGPAFSAIAHIANVAVGNEPLDGVGHSLGSYRVRHLVSAALALLAALAVGVAVWRLAGSPRFGLWAAAGLLAVPVWMGQGFFNVKDIPAGTGYTLLTVALALALIEAPNRGSSRLRKFGIGAMLALGIFVGAGTRLSLWVPFAASLLAYAALRAGQWRLGGGSIRRDADLAVAAGALIGVAAIAAIYPKVATTPVSLLLESVSNSAEYPYEGFTLTAGRLVDQNPPWWYLPVWIGASYPLLLGALALLGTAVGLRNGIGPASARRRLGAILNRRELGLLLVLLQALLLPIAAIAKGAVMYNGMRQHLYVLPAIAILAGVGAAYLWRWAASRRRPRMWKRLAAGVLCLALLVPMAEQTLLFPYNYAYVNPAAGLGGVNNRWETDYWFASAPEALSRVPRGVELLCSSFLVPPWAPHSEPELKPCEGDEFEPFEDRRGTDVVVPHRRGESAVWVIGRKRGGNHPPPYCEEAGDISRWLRGENVLMAYVLRCNPERVAGR